MSLLTSLFSFFALAASAAAGSFANLSVAEFAKLVERPGVVVLDVRTAEEFAGGHIPGAINVDVTAAGFEQKVAALKLKKDAVVAVYCRSGRRSANACKILTQAGYKNVSNLSTGIVGWTGAGKKVVR